MKAKKRHIDKALKSLGIIDCDFDSEQTLDAYIAENTQLINDAKAMIEELKTNIWNAEESLLTLHELKHQIKVEIYKELNPDKAIN